MSSSEVILEISADDLPDGYTDHYLVTQSEGGATQWFSLDPTYGIAQELFAPVNPYESVL